MDNVVHPLSRLKLSYPGDRTPRHVFDIPKTNNGNLMGVELEVENVVYHHPDSEEYKMNMKHWNNDWWNTHEDSSLKVRGVEYVSYPAYFEDYKNERLPALYKFLGTLAEQPDFSVRAGTHIHINVSDCTFTTIRKIILLYMLFEGVFFEACQSHRRDSIFCVPVTDTSAIASMLCMGNFDSGEVTKYSALNICCLRKYGTLEFRMFESADSPEKILHWMELILALVDFCKQDKATLEVFVDNLIELNSTSAFHMKLCDVFGGLIKDYNYDKIVKTMVLAIIRLKTLLSGLSSDPLNMDDAQKWVAKSRTRFSWRT